jgi:hypothetical protein
MSKLLVWFSVLLTCGLGCPRLAVTGEPDENPEEAARRGYRYLLDHAYVPPYFDTETFEQCWEAWPSAERARARDASPTERRQMAFARYGWTPRPLGRYSIPSDVDKPLQFVIDEDGNWTPN